jgi:hypothetical protein
MIMNVMRFLFPTLVPAPERARDEKGRLVGDDKSTPTINEAWVGGKAPAKKVAPKAAPKKRGRPKGSKTKKK